MGSPIPLSRISRTSSAPSRRAAITIRPRGFEGLCGYVPDHLQPVLKADLLDVQVHPQKIDLLAQGNDLVAGVVQREPKQSPQASDHLVRRIGLSVDQLRDGVEGIEEEVGLKLHLENLKVAPGQSGFELRSVQLPGAIQSEVVG